MIIINKSIESSMVPILYKKARIIPLYKKGKTDECGNYRPVSLLPALLKILEKAICSQLMNYLQTYNILCSSQYGFRPKCQTSHVVHDMLNTISNNSMKNQCTIATFIDLSKAFDSLQYNRLFKKMEYMGFTKESTNWFRNYLTDRQQCVEVKDTLSDWNAVKLGVPQVSILGPILFLIYVNDINNSDKGSKFVKFADNTPLLTTGKDIEEATSNMNNALSKVKDWFLMNKLNLNPSKTRYMIFNHKTLRAQRLIDLEIPVLILSLKSSNVELG